MSLLSTTSSVDDFINAKIESITADLEVNNKFGEIFKDAKKRKAFTDKEYSDASKDLQSEIKEKERELLTLKRQKKTISEDIDEAMPQFSTVADAYSSVLMTKIMTASSNQRRGKPFDQRIFTKAVLSFYGAVRDGGDQKYCHLTGWQGGALVKCAHIVPKSLESDELAYLFGVRETILSEPRNGMSTSTLQFNVFLTWKQRNYS
jgi:hypothetical protein